MARNRQKINLTFKKIPRFPACSHKKKATF